MKYEVKFYEAPNGKRPAEDFLSKLWRKQPKLAKHTLANLKKLEDSERHGPPLVKNLEDNLFELRTGSANITRIFFSYRQDQSIWLLSGYVKTTDRIPQTELDKARALRDECERSRQ